MVPRFTFLSRNQEPYDSDYRLVSTCLAAAVVDKATKGYGHLFNHLRETFSAHETGCTDPTGPIDVYTWRRVGHGSNVISEFRQWWYVYMIFLALAVHYRRGLKIIGAEKTRKNDPTMCLKSMHMRTIALHRYLTHVETWYPEASVQCDRTFCCA